MSGGAAPRARAARRGGALVTGGARRVGRAVALALAAGGYAVAVHAHRSLGEARALADEIVAAGGRAGAVAGDLAEVGAVEGLVAAAEAAVGPLELLVNNASIFEEDDAASLTAAVLDAHHAVNLRAPLLLARDFAARATAGPFADPSIVNIIDQRVWRPTPRFLSYGLSKAGLWAATRALAQGLAPRVRVNAVGPGPALASKRQSAEDFAALEAAVPLRRGGPPGEVAAAVLYLAGARSVTGQMIAVDGGQHLAWETPDVVGVRE